MIRDSIMMDPSVVAIINIILHDVSLYLSLTLIIKKFIKNIIFFLKLLSIISSVITVLYLGINN